MVLRASVGHSRHGYHLYVVEVPLWAVLVERAGEEVCDKTGQLLCAAGLPEWAWKLGAGRRDDDGYPRWNLGNALFDFGQWLHTIDARREKRRAAIPVSVDWVAEHFPEARMEFLED